MRIIRPGVAIGEAPDEVRRGTLGRAVCALIVVGWAVTALGAQLQGADATTDAWLLTAIGVVSGLTWMTKRFDRQSETSLQVVLAAASLQSTAAALAFDHGVIAAWPFAVLLALAAGQVARTRAQLAGQAGLIAAGPLVAAGLGPDRAPHAMEAALVLAACVPLLALASAGVRELLESRARSVSGDVRLVHERLAEVVAADPERFAVLAMDHGFSLVAADTGGAGAAVLARKIEEAMAEYRHAETGDLNAAIGIAVYPDDGRTPDELLARADAALAEVKAAGHRLRAIVPATR